MPVGVIPEGAVVTRIGTNLQGAGMGFQLVASGIAVVPAETDVDVYRAVPAAGQGWVPYLNIISVPVTVYSLSWGLDGVAKINANIIYRNDASGALNLANNANVDLSVLWILMGATVLPQP